MIDRALLSAGRHNIQDCIQLALRHNLGIEIMAFAFPQVLDSNWQSLLAAYRNMLRPVRGPITMHGPFMDMAPGSPDSRINQICIDRYQHAIRIAADIEAELIVFHANFIAAIHNIEYRQGWHSRNVDFWGEMAEYASGYGIKLAVENMWEFDPKIIPDVLREVNHPYLRACLDIGHAHLFTEPEFTFDEWVETLEPWLIHLHINNNNGRIDKHRGLHDGVLDYHELLPRFRTLPNPPTITLEMDTVQDMEASLPYLKLKRSTGEFRKTEA